MLNRNNSILFLGDVVPYKPFKYRNNYKTIINLECPIISGGNPVEGKINLSVKKNYLGDIFKNNIICVSLGNNHILDFGKEGLDSTLDELTKIGIRWFGINNNFSKSLNPLIFEFNETKIALFAAVCESTSPVVSFKNENYLSILNPDKLIDKASEIKNMVQRTVVYMHWGIEESSYPTKEDILTARKLIDGGIDIVIGSHAHAPQPIERYKSGIIAYNLGNFLMPALNNIPTYFDKTRIPHNKYNKRIMLWNRISWGLLIDLKTLDYKIIKYMFVGNRIIKLPVTPFDRFIHQYLDPEDKSYELKLEKHLRNRAFFRKLNDFIHNPHVPQKIRNKIWK